MKTKYSIPILDNLIQSLKTDNFQDDSFELLSPKEVAEYLGMHIGSIYKLIGSGKLKAYDLSSGNRKTYYRVKRVDLENYLEERYCG